VGSQEDLRVQEWEEASTLSPVLEEEEEQEVSPLDSHSEGVKVDSRRVIRTTSLRVSSAVWVVWEEWEACRVEEERVRDEKLQEGTPLRRWEVEEDSPAGSEEVWEWILTTTI